jgi:hypothetical protein
VDQTGKIERSLDIPEEAFAAIERDLVKGANEGTVVMPNGVRFNWFLDR